MILKLLLKQTILQMLQTSSSQVEQQFNLPIDLNELVIIVRNIIDTIIRSQTYLV